MSFTPHISKLRFKGNQVSIYHRSTGQYMQTAGSSMSSFEWLLLIILSVLWGGSFFFVGIAVEALPPFTIVAIRVSVAAVALIAVVYLSGLRLPTSPTIWLAFFGLGIINNLIPFSLIVWGQTHISSGLASVLNATTPIFGVIAAHFLTRDEKATRLKLLGVSLGLIGVAIMIGKESLSGLGTNLYAQFAVLGASMSYALASIYGRRFGRLKIQPLVIATSQVTASSILFIPIALVVDTPFSLPMPGLNVWFALAGLALASTSLAYIIYFRILSTAGATNVLLVTLLIPVSAVLLGTLFLGEQLELQHYLGMALIGSGLISIDGRIFRRFRKKHIIHPASLS